MSSVKKCGNKYRIRIFLGSDGQGKPISRSMTWDIPEGWSEKKAEKEAQRQALLFEQRFQLGVARPDMKFSQFADYWMESYAISNLSPKTVHEYSRQLTVINKGIGNIMLSKLTPLHLMDLYKKIMDDSLDPTPDAYVCICDLSSIIKKTQTYIAFTKKANIGNTTLTTARQKKPISPASAYAISSALGMEFRTLFKPYRLSQSLSASSIKHYHRLLSSILNDAVAWQYIPYNPVSKIKPPKSHKPEISYLEEDEAQHLIQLLKKEPEIYKDPILFLLFTGLRKSELLGLQWHDINFKNHTMHISRTAQYIPHQGTIIGDTKNKFSRRFVVLSDSAIEILNEHYLWQQECARKQGENWNNTNAIFTNEDGSVMSPNRLSNWFYKFIRKSDLPNIHVHSLRHTYATLSLSAGAPLNGVSAQLGHATISTTANIYTHTTTAAQLAVASSIDSILGNV